MLNTKSRDESSVEALTTGASVLRVAFSHLVDTSVLLLLHAEGLSEKLPPDFCQLMKSARIEQITEVYHLALDEIVDDRYGFAREFKCALYSQADWEASMQVLQHSPLVHMAQPLSVRRGYTDEKCG